MNKFFKNNSENEPITFKERLNNFTARNSITSRNSLTFKELNKPTNNLFNINNDSNSIIGYNKNNEWSIENEMIIVEWCDIAQCYKWMNSQAHLSYSWMNTLYTIPAIVLSTISGTASFAQTSLPTKYQSFAPMIICTLNIFLGFLT